MAIARIAKTYTDSAFSAWPSSAPADGEEWARCAARGTGEEIIPLVVDDDERGEVTYLDLPHRFHPQFRVLEHIDPGDAVLCQLRGGATDRAKIEPAVRLAGRGYGGGPV